MTETPPEPPAVGAPPIREPRPATWRERFREAAPLAAVGLAFLAGAALASLDHWRIFSSEFPLWILLALDGGVAVIAGGMAFFVAEPDRPIDDDPGIVRVPRAEWESLLRRLEIVTRSTGQRGAAPEWSEALLPAPVTRAPSPGGPAPSAPSAGATAGPTAAPAPPPVPAPSREELRREMGWLELQGFAESAVSTGESLGPSELQALLEASIADLERIAAELGRPRDPGEPPAELLLRLLREEPGQSVKAGTRWRPPELDRLAKRLEEILPKAKTPADQRRSVTDEFEALLRELETTAQAPPERRKPSGGKTPPPK